MCSFSLPAFNDCGSSANCIPYTGRDATCLALPSGAPWRRSAYLWNDRIKPQPVRVCAPPLRGPRGQGWAKGSGRERRLPPAEASRWGLSRGWEKGALGERRRLGTETPSLPSDSGVEVGGRLLDPPGDRGQGPRRPVGCLRGLSVPLSSAVSGGRWEGRAPPLDTPFWGAPFPASLSASQGRVSSGGRWL